MINLDITPEQLEILKAELEVIKTLADLSRVHLQRSQEAPEGSAKALAEVLVAGAVQDVGRKRTDDLAKAIGLDLTATDPVGQFHELLAAIDGNRRSLTFTKGGKTYSGGKLFK